VFNNSLSKSTQSYYLNIIAEHRSR